MASRGVVQGGGGSESILSKDESQEYLIKQAQGRDVMFRCDLCDFIAYGPDDLEAHVLSDHAVPVDQANGVPLSAVTGAVPVKKHRRKSSRHDMGRHS